MAARGGEGAVSPAIAAAARRHAGGPDADVLLGVQVWAAGVKPAAEPSLAARVSGGYTPEALTRGPLAVRLGAAAAFSFIDEEAGRVSFTSLLALPGLRLQLGPRATALADLGLGLLVIWGSAPARCWWGRAPRRPGR